MDEKGRMMACQVPILGPRGYEPRALPLRNMPVSSVVYGFGPVNDHLLTRSSCSHTWDNIHDDLMVILTVLVYLGRELLFCPTPTTHPSLLYL